MPQHAKPVTLSPSRSVESSSVASIWKKTSSASSSSSSETRMCHSCCAVTSHAESAARRSGHSTCTSYAEAVGASARRTESALAWLDSSVTKKGLTLARPSDVCSGRDASVAREKSSAAPRRMHPCRATPVESGPRLKACCVSDSVKRPLCASSLSLRIIAWEA